MLSLSPFVRDETAVGAVEFAFATPVIVLLMLGGLETASYVRTSLHVEMAASSIAAMISQSQASPGATVKGNGLVTAQQFNFFRESMLFTLPEAQTEAAQRGVVWTDLARVSIWNVNFKPNSATCGATCTYTPNVVWSFNGGPPCGATINQAPNNAVVTPTTLPVSVYGPGSLIVVQVVYDYYPTFGASWMGPSQLTRTALLAPRNVPVVESNDVADSAATCAGSL